MKTYYSHSLPSIAQIWGFVKGGPSRGPSLGPRAAWQPGLDVRAEYVGGAAGRGFGTPATHDDRSLGTPSTSVQTRMITAIHRQRLAAAGLGPWCVRPQTGGQRPGDCPLLRRFRRATRQYADGGRTPSRSGLGRGKARRARPQATEESQHGREEGQHGLRFPSTDVAKQGRGRAARAGSHGRGWGCRRFRRSPGPAPSPRTSPPGSP